MAKLLPPLTGAALLGKPIKLLPDNLLALPLEPMINRLLKKPILDGAFDYLKHRWVNVVINDIGLTIYLGFNGTRLIVVPPRPCDVELSASMAALLSLVTQPTKADTFFDGQQLVITGDAELSRSIKNSLMKLKSDQLPAEVRASLLLRNKITSRRKEAMP